nr:hypothetical protein [Tanacetum cinerariifolium]
MGDEHLDIIPATKSDELIKSSVENLVPIPSESEGIRENMCDVPFHDNSPSLDISKDQFENFSDSNDDSTSIDDDSFSIDDIEFVKASPLDSEPISLEVMEIVIQEVGGIDVDIILTIKDDILCDKLLNINLLIANIEALKDNPTPYSDFMTKSFSTSFNFLLEETNTFDNSLPESETFCFDLEENSSGSTTTRADISFPDYEAFYDGNVKEISSGSTTTHSNFSLYDSFIFDLSINPFPLADRSDFYEFVDELAHIISPPEYDCFSFKNEPNSGDFTMDVVEDIFPTKEPRVHVYNVLPTHPTLQLNLDFILSSKSLFAYVIDSLLDEFVGELTILKSIPPRIDETDCSLEEERLLYDNSSPRPPEEFVSVNSDAKIESFSPSPIPIKDNDSLIEEIDLSFTSDYPMPLGIEDDDYDSERDILILKDLPSIDTLSLSEIELFYLIFLRFLVLLRNYQMEKSPDLLSHRGLKTFLLSAKCR